MYRSTPITLETRYISVSFGIFCRWTLRISICCFSWALRQRFHMVYWRHHDSSTLTLGRKHRHNVGLCLISRSALHCNRVGYSYHTGACFFAQGGFAKCYELTDVETKEVYAGKIVPKSILMKPHHREKVKRQSLFSAHTITTTWKNINEINFNHISLCCI